MISALNKKNPNLLPFTTLIILLVAWELDSYYGIISTIFFPPPSKIWAGFIKLSLNGSLFSATTTTLFRFLAGLISGAFLGAALGLLMGRYSGLNAFFSPYIAALYPIPKIAIFPLLMVVFGIGEGSKFVAIFLGAFFPMLISTLSGVQQINKIYFDVGKNYGIDGKKAFSHILIPGSLPSIMAGLRLAANVGFIVTISVEIISARNGLGVLLWFSWQTLRVNELYAVLVVIAITGIVLSYVIDQMTERLIPWLP
ncbi:MAG: ABC transporter permease [Anaerolineae bacterium]|jgi:ABC-type nitrate/sulfonate/bicarbonate transport system permease component|nr:ABC transporter permease [Anaerolineae bacterium]MBT7326663.1 ABC transporter permease [Anaerolineae bacterium]